MQFQEEPDPAFDLPMEGMLTLANYTAMVPGRQMEVLGELGVWIAEQGKAGSYHLYYALEDFFVEIELISIPVTKINLHAFTRAHTAFDELVEALPVDLEPIVDPAR